MTKEVENVLRLDNRKKYEYFIKKIVAFEEVWSLRNEEGWITSGMGDEVFFPVWAKKEFAELYISGDWQDCKCESIDIDDFLEDWLEGLQEDGIRVSVMWHDGAGIDVDWERLAEDIEAELELYE